MGNGILIASILGPIYLILGLSLVIHPKSWHKMMKKWADDHYNLFPLQLMALSLGIVIIRMHNIWEWDVWLIVTIIGWIAALKGIYYFLATGKSIHKVIKTFNKESTMYFGGIVSLLLGALLSYLAYFA